ncbi:MAG: 50S ribosomal protein L15 [Micavibrio aeruginosavorus]|uniref:Large ribosomal subunit protein uL15 n=1 Tax=Micavibrio aeruginosavorus TaxID=349221 RepID=A0A2W5MV82_9BACT|nr:MAG: 50S ribosomal protein L15 [Micavibrio aeruginosavorus]
MKLNELKPNEGAKHNYKRVGRGIGSGKGKTAGVGVKGQKARSGVAIKGFEGGQMPLYMRLPKHGFKNFFGKEYAIVTLARLEQAIASKLIDTKGVIDEDTLLKNKVISHKRDGVRLIGNGTLKSKVSLKISGATKSAAEAVSKAGGSLEIIKIEVAPVVRKKAK